MMASAQGDKVSLTPGTWIAFWGLALALLGSFLTAAYGLHMSRMEDRERLIRVEMSTQSTASGVQAIAAEVKFNGTRIDRHESRIERLEAKK